MLRDHQGALFRHAQTILSEEEEALDATQSSLLLIARKLGTLHDPRWFRAWAYRLTTREAVRLAARRGRERLRFDDVDVEALEVAAPEPDDFVQEWGAAIGALPPASRLVVQMHYKDGLTLLEIAEALEIPLGTVKSRLAAGLVRLRDSVRASS